MKRIPAGRGIASRTRNLHQTGSHRPVFCSSNPITAARDCSVNNPENVSQSSSLAALSFQQHHSHHKKCFLSKFGALRFEKTVSMAHQSSSVILLAPILLLLFTGKSFNFNESSISTVRNTYRESNININIKSNEIIDE